MPMAMAIATAKPATISCWLRSSSCQRGRCLRSSVGRLRKDMQEDLRRAGEAIVPGLAACYPMGLRGANALGLAESSAWTVGGAHERQRPPTQGQDPQHRLAH